MPINPLPNGTQALVPYLVVKNANKAIEFYKKVFAAEEMMRMPGPDGKKVMHAELRVAGCMMYLGEECNEGPMKAPKKGNSVAMTLYCLDADKVFDRAKNHGAKVVKPMQDQFWGDRMGTVCDPFGHMWTLMTRKEELTVEEVMERGRMAMAGAK